jgi:FSR family fosmidomycin resistance protein-like MFS transporter
LDLLKNKHALLWGSLHGLNDLAAGFMLANYTFTHSNNDSFLFIVFYSVIGFGGQLPVGFLLDFKKNIQPFANVSVLLLPLSIIAWFISPEAGIFISGLASAFVHVTGGAICLQTNDGKNGPLAIFTAPGVLGLTLGSVLGHQNNLLLIVAGAMILLNVVLIIRNKIPVYNAHQKRGSELDMHDWLMMGILLIMCFRSLIFDVINRVSQDFENGVLIIGISAFAGKIIGGFIADRIGWKKFIYITLPLALILFQFGKENIYALAFGIACLQSSVPITLLLMARSLPRYPATATAMSLGASIALAGLPLYLIKDQQRVNNYFSDPFITAAIFVLLIGGWLLADRFLFRKKFSQQI